jgi:cytochrome c oxidase assembly factor CtaG
VDGPSPLTSWTFEPLQLVPILLVALVYARRAHTLARRGTPVATWRLWCFGLGIALLVIALASPIDALGEQQFLWAHMTQHILLGDLAPLALVAGLTGPLLQPVLQFGPVQRLRVLAHPLVALPLWAIDLYAWHLPFLYQAALHHNSVHALEHLLFLSCGALMWAPIVEVLPGPAWFGTGAKLGYIAVVRLLETVLGNIFIWSGHVFYPYYQHALPRWGLSAHSDQGVAGAIMMIEGSIVTLAALAWLFLRWGAESELRQRLIEEGLDPAAVSRAVRYGRGEELAGRR